MTPGKAGLAPERRQELESLEQRLGHRFEDLELLDQALRHSSYAHENPASGPSNEQLEFLGDAVLALTVSTLLLARFPGNSEGDLSRGRAALVNARQLAGLARRLGLGAHLWLGRGEERQEGREKPSLLADALEAVLAAVYLDGGLEAAANLTERWFSPLMETALPWQDYQDLTAGTHPGPLQGLPLVSSLGRKRARTRPAFPGRGSPQRSPSGPGGRPHQKTGGPSGRPPGPGGLAVPGG